VNKRVENHKQNTLSADIAIIGGGLVGASLAVALRNTPLSVVVVEAVPLNHSAQPSYNDRTVALTWNARQIYSAMGIWEDIATKDIEPIKDIHVSSSGQFGATHLDAQDVETEALGYVVSTRLLGEVLYKAIHQSDNITLFEGACAQSLTTEALTNSVEIEQDGKLTLLQSRLVVLADGGRSELNNIFSVVKQLYSQSALLSFVSIDRPHHGRAYERFTSEGPIALLPHSDNRYALVWTCEPERLNHRLALNDQDFLKELQVSFGDRAGNFTAAAPRKHYPLERLKVENPVSGRCVLIGNAAHTVHPVAGQGFNLGLRDVAELAELIASSAAQDKDIGDFESLSHYASLRRRDTQMVHRFTHSLISLFSSPTLPLKIAQSAILNSIEILPPVKRLLLRRTMGLAGTHSRLASLEIMSRLEKNGLKE